MRTGCKKIFDTTYEHGNLDIKYLGGIVYAEKNYISGLISGTTDYMERFASMETRLRELGYSVINPARECASLPESTTWKGYRRVFKCEMKDD
jgi:hypothetical protein